MSQLEKITKTCFSFVGYILGLVFGGFDSLIGALLIFMVIDYITGVIEAYFSNKISSSIGFKGILKKMMILFVIALANIVDKSLIGTGSSIRTMSIMFYLSNEAISILENASLLGIPLPKKLKDMLDHFNNTNNS